MQFLFEGAWEVVREVDEGSWGYKEEAREIEAHYFDDDHEEGQPRARGRRRKGRSNPLEKYRHANVVDYGDEFPRLPQGMNPLNPALADPAVARRGRLRLHRGGFLQQQQQQQQLLQQLQDEHDQLWGGGGRRQRGTLSPDLPLMELFWRTLLPWNTVMGTAR